MRGDGGDIQTQKQYKQSYRGKTKKKIDVLIEENGI